jgi:hypothetical protein
MPPLVFREGPSWQCRMIARRAPSPSSPPASGASPLLSREIVPRTRFDLLRGVGTPGSPRQAARKDRCVRGYGRRKQGQGHTREKLAPRRTSRQRAAAGELWPRIGPARRLGIRPHRSSAEVKPSPRTRAGRDRPAAKVNCQAFRKGKCQNPLDGSTGDPKPATPHVFVSIPRENSVVRMGSLREELIFSLNPWRASIHTDTLRQSF